MPGLKKPSACHTESLRGVHEAIALSRSFLRGPAGFPAVRPSLPVLFFFRFSYLLPRPRVREPIRPNSVAVHSRFLQVEASFEIGNSATISRPCPRPSEKPCETSQNPRHTLPWRNSIAQPRVASRRGSSSARTGFDIAIARHRKHQNEPTIMRHQSIVWVERPSNAIPHSIDASESQDNDQAENNGNAGQATPAVDIDG